MVGLAPDVWCVDGGPGALALLAFALDSVWTGLEFGLAFWRKVEGGIRIGGISVGHFL